MTMGSGAHSKPRAKSANRQRRAIHLSRFTSGKCALPGHSIGYRPLRKGQWVLLSSSSKLGQLVVLDALPFFHLYQDYLLNTENSSCR